MLSRERVQNVLDIATYVALGVAFLVAIPGYVLTWPWVKLRDICFSPPVEPPICPLSNTVSDLKENPPS